jgi:hypothetical protein
MKTGQERTIGEDFLQGGRASKTERVWFLYFFVGNWGPFVAHTHARAQFRYLVHCTQRNDVDVQKRNEGIRRETKFEWGTRGSFQQWLWMNQWEKNAHYI